MRNHGHAGGVHIAGLQRHRARDVAAGIGGLLIDVDAAEGTLRQILADQLQRQLQAGGEVLDGGHIELQYVHHGHHLVRHAEQHADVVAVDQLLEVGVEVELLFLIRGRRHLARQRDHLEQGADLIREHQGHIALGLALDADDHARYTGCRRGASAR